MESNKVKILAVLLAVVLIGGGYYIYTQNLKIERLQNENSYLTKKANELETDYKAVNAENDRLKEQLAEVNNTVYTTSDDTAQAIRDLSNQLAQMESDRVTERIMEGKYP